MKKIISAFAVTVLLVCLCATVFSSAADTPSDPSEIYEVQTAPYEDESLQLWFEHSFKKVMTSDTTHSGMDTYSVYMGKNEIENAQFVLYSDETKTKLRATVSEFTDAEGNTVDAEIYYQMYVTLEDLYLENYPGATAETSFIREGEQPDPMVPLSTVNVFQLNAGKSQAFYIRLTTTEDTKSGWYSAQLDIKNSKGQIIKTATVYAYVWDFTIDEKTELKTAFYMTNVSSKYESWYNYLLENRICAMDVPGDITSSNKYLTNERVSAIRVSAVGGGNVRQYLDGTSVYPQYADIYNDLSSMAAWDSIKDKFYFYTLDECLNPYYGGTGSVDDVKSRSDLLDKYWNNASKVVPYHINHYYPYDLSLYNQPLANMDRSLMKDATQELLDSGDVTIFCPRYYGYTNLEDINKYNYSITDDSRPVRNLSGTSSGNFLVGEWAFMWEDIYGDYKDRAISNMIIENRDENNKYETWIYSAGNNGGYTYANHLIENTGLQTKIMFWQLYSEDITGYLYYGANFWDEHKYDLDGDGEADDVYIDTTVTGSKTGKWATNRRLNYPYSDGHSIYGNGMIFYGGSQSGYPNLDYVGTVRVEMMRDGIEEYQMLCMLEELRGDEACDDIISQVYTSMVNYISLPCFDTSGFDSSMDEYDIMAQTRIRLGNELEAASRNVCEHDYDDGKVVLEATCLKMGEIVYTCKDCGAQQSEYIPTLHSEGDCFNVTEITATDCNTDGYYRYDCTVCGYAKYETVESYHSNSDYYKYVPHATMTAVHSVICTECDEELRTENHSTLAEYTNTCTEAGVHNDVCKFCGYTKYVEDVEAKGHYLDETVVEATCYEEGYKISYCHNCDYSEEETYAQLEHNFVDGVCTHCGESTVQKGDVDGDGDLNMLDLYMMKVFLKQADTPTEAEALAADIDGDGAITMLDSYALRYRLSTGNWKE